MQCVILAGGLATRMRPVTQTIPKSLIPIVSNRPFIDFQLRHLKSQGVTKVVLCIGHLGEKIEKHVSSSTLPGLEVRFSNEGDELKGTAGALRLAMEQNLLEDRFFVTYGDSFLPVSYSRVFDYARNNPQFDAVMTVCENENRWDKSNACFSNGQVSLYDKNLKQKKPAEMRFIDYGLSVLTKKVLQDQIPATPSYDLADVFHRLSVEGKLGGVLVEERFYEIGSFAGLSDFQAYIQEQDPRLGMI